MKYPIDFIGKIIQGDCIEVLKTMPDNCVDAIVSDPPAGISFMGKSWDTFDKDMFGKKGQEGTNDLKVKKNFDILPRYGNADMLGFQDFICQAFTEAIRVLKPGGYALVWAIPRTSHHTAMGLERAGFEIRDVVNHIFGSGFPKSLNIGKAIDKLQGNERDIIDTKIKKAGDMRSGNFKRGGDYPDIELNITKGNSEYEGWGTALKPAVEHWILCRKPLSEKTVAENVLKWGTGGINIDGCRIGTMGEKRPLLEHTGRSGKIYGAGLEGSKSIGITEQGRFPANLILECICDEVIDGVATGSPGHWGKTKVTGFGKFGSGKSEYNGVGKKDDMKCFIHTNPLCPCYMLDRQSGKLKSGTISKDYKQNYRFNIGEKGTGNNLNGSNCYGDKGGASRFFYCAKASKSERNMGCEGLDNHNPCYESHRPNYKNTKGIETPYAGTGRGGGDLRNNHPTVKPLSLCKYLVKLITPPGGIVLDPFAGSGSTLIAAKLEGFNFIGIEKEADYVKIANARLNAWHYERRLF